MKLTLLRFAFAGLFLLGAVWATQQQDFSNVEIKATQVRGNVYMLEGRGGNIGVSVGEDGILIVDDQYAPLSEKIRAALSKLNNGPLKFVLNTHWHGDHTGGNPFFGKEATIVAHASVRKRLMTEQRRGERITPPLPKEGWPVITLESSLSLHFNGEEIKVMHFPRGHTDGDCVIFFVNANVVHMGDDFFVARFPFVDLVSGGRRRGLDKKHRATHCATAAGCENHSRTWADLNAG
jgi:glyoxylase-like metal-dependent hydrolase (beta-lactamase superfamily II)